jgi:hypothetical protein
MISLVGDRPTLTIDPFSRGGTPRDAIKVEGDVPPRLNGT